MSTIDAAEQQAASGPGDTGGRGPEAPELPGVRRSEAGRSRGLGRWYLLVADGACVAAVAVLALAVKLSSAWWFGGIAGAVVALIVGSAVVRSRIDDRPLPLWQRWAELGVAAAVTALGGGLVWAWIVGRVADGGGFVGVSLALLGLGHMMLQVRSVTGRRLWRGPAALAGSAALVVVGLVALAHGAPGWSWWALLVGILSVPVGLGLLTGDVLDRLAAVEMGRGPRRVLLAGALGLMAVGTAVMIVSIGLPARYAIGGAVVFLLLIGAIASKTTTDAILVIGVIALAWAIAPRSVANSAAMTVEDGDSVIVALGDSYMSGEGAESYFAGTNHRRTNECRRAPTAYPVRVVGRDDAAIPDDVVFLACSGAKSIDIYQRAQYPDEPVGAGEGGGSNQLAQLHALREDVDVDIDMVVVSVGGNDAGFGEVGRTCIAPGDCSELADQWLGALDAVGPTVGKAYAAIRDEVGPEVPVVVVPYPIPLDEDGCGSSALTSGEHRFLHDFTRRLDGVLRKSAADAGFHYLDEMVTSLADARLRVCDRPSGVGVNSLAANPVEGVVRDQVNPLHWFHNSLHPNERGHAAMAEVLGRWIHDHPELPATPPSDSEVGAPASASDSPPAELRAATQDADDWAVDQTVGLLWRLGIPVLLVATGAWALWIHVFWTLRRRSGRGRRTELTMTELAMADTTDATTDTVR